MRFSAKVLYLPISPFKLRAYVDVIRGKSVVYAIQWLSTLAVRRSVPIKKMIQSAAANAKNLKNIDIADLVISDIRVDHGPMYKYFKPGAMGRSNVYRKRFSHASVILEPFANKKD